ncbi:MAG TPA: ABC transporter permease [Gemmatimonadaceae bacterium]|nr:ABC transporter permease [Gemmatimonadaceae bacterium]
MTRLEIAIAWRYLRSRRGSQLLSLISIIAMGGVVVGVSALILVLGVMNGLQKDLRDKILIGSPDLRVLTVGDDLTMTDWQATLAKVRAQQGVVAAQPFVLKDALITKNNDYAEPVKVVGLPAAVDGAPDVTQIRRFAKSGAFTFRAPDDTSRAIVIGQRLAERLNAWPGTVVTLATVPGRLKMSSAIGGFIPMYRRYVITGVFETGMYEYDSGYAYMELSSAQDLAGLEQRVTGIDVRTPDRDEAPVVAQRLATTLGFPYRTIDWQEQNRSLFQALSLEKLAMGVILLLIVLVAAFNIVSTLTMVVTDKTREIGILKAMGMPSATIRRIFLWQGAAIGLVGTLLGVALGLAGAWALSRFKLIALDPQVYFIDRLPIEIAVGDVLFIIAASLGIAMLATLWPARQASRLFPVEAIRHE